jgi:hypothetical protein
VAELATLVSAGGGGLLDLVIIYLLAGNRADRQQYEDLVDRAEARATAAEVRERAAQQLLDDALRQRREAEEAAARLGREVARLRERDERR